MFISKNKDTNFESNSQLYGGGYVGGTGLYQRTKIQILKAIHNWFVAQRHAVCVYIKEQRYKFWKQFTTNLLANLAVRRLYQRTKIQILKAIHNW